MPKIKLTQQLVQTLSVPEGKRKIDYFDTEQKGLMLEVRQSGKTYAVRYQNQRGRTQQKKLAGADVIKLVDARALAQEKLAMIAMGNDPFELKRELSKVPLVSEFVRDHYVPHIETYKRSAYTDKLHLKNYILPAIGHLHLDEVKRHNIMALLTSHRQNHKPASTNRILILVRYIFNCAIQWEIAEGLKNPSKGIKLFAENNKRERYLEREEANRLFKTVEESENTVLLPIITILLLTGARLSEVLNAKWQDFDMARRVWTINFNKSGKPRYVPISDALINTIQAIPAINGCEWLVPNPKTLKPFVSIFNSWNTARKRAGLPDVRLHDLRHSFASFLINNGRSIYEVQKILGHTQISTTQRYAHLSQDSLISAANTAADCIPLGKTPATLEHQNYS